MVEKTGYPKDMLDLDLDLEADLGVDTVKQAEMFAAIREIYNIPRDENRKLRDYPTLAHVIRFVYEKRPDLAAAPAATEEVELTTPNIPVVAEKPAPTATSTPAATADASRNEFSRWRWRRPATRKTCWTWISISKPTRRRHCETGGDVRCHPRDLQHPAR